MGENRQNTQNVDFWPKTRYKSLELNFWPSKVMCAERGSSSQPASQILYILDKRPNRRRRNRTEIPKIGWKWLKTGNNYYFFFFSVHQGGPKIGWSYGPEILHVHRKSRIFHPLPCPSWFIAEIRRYIRITEKKRCFRVSKFEFFF